VGSVTKQRQHYNEEFKKKAVQYVQEQTKTLPEIAEEMQIPAGTLKNWMTKYRSFENEPVVTANAEKLREMEAKLKASEREKNDLEEELAILKKALHIFSKEKN